MLADCFSTTVIALVVVVLVLVLADCFSTTVVALVVVVDIFVSANIFAADVALMVLRVFICVSVVDGYNHFGRYISCLVGNNDFLCALCRLQCKLIAFIQSSRSAVYGDAFKIVFCNGKCLFFAIGLSVFNSEN